MSLDGTPGSSGNVPTRLDQSRGRSGRDGEDTGVHEGKEVDTQEKVTGETDIYPNSQR